MALTEDDVALLAAFGFRVRSLRQRAKLSQADLADRAGMHATYLSGIERGRRNLSLLNIYALSDALGVSMSVLLEIAAIDPDVLDT